MQVVFFRSTTDQYKSRKIARPEAIGFEMYGVVWDRDGEHVFISAPTLDVLANNWLEITGMPLDVHKAQHVEMLEFWEAV